jgi:hypothetical protein
VDRTGEPVPGLSGPCRACPGHAGPVRAMPGLSGADRGHAGAVTPDGVRTKLGPYRVWNVPGSTAAWQAKLGLAGSIKGLT